MDLCCILPSSRRGLLQGEYMSAGSTEFEPFKPIPRTDGAKDFHPLPKQLITRCSNVINFKGDDWR